MDRLRWWLLGSAVPVGAACAVAAGVSGAEAVGDLALAALGVATAAVTWAAGRSKQPGWRGWRLIAAAPLLPVIGLLAVTVVAPADPVEQVALRWLPTVPAYVLVVAGILTLVAPSRLRRGARPAVELALFLIACVLVVQVLVLGPELDWLDLTPSGRAVLAAAVVATSAAMAAALLLLGAIESRRQPMALVLLAATAVLASGRALVTSATLTGEEAIGDLGRFLVAGGMVLLGAAVLLDPGPCPDAGPPPCSGRSTELRQLLPHLAMTVACLGAAAVSLAGHRISPVIAIGGSVCAGLAVLHRWMTAREEQRVGARLRRSEAYFRSLVAASGDAVLILDRGLRVTWSSPTLGTTLGDPDAAPVGADLLDLVHPDDVASVVAALRPDGGDAAPSGVLALRLRHADGSWRHLEAGVSDLRTDAVVGAVVLHCRDTTERVERERTLEQLAFTDPVTGLPNRAGCERRLADVLVAGGPCRSLLLIELDGLDEVREDAGRDVVTAVLVEIGRRLRATVRSGDLVSRVGGGAFAVLAEGAPHAVDLLADRCLSVIEQPLDTPAGVFDLNAGIGVVEVGAADSVGDLMVRAELAVRAAASSGTGSALRYRPALGSAAERRARLREDLPGAWDRGELSVLFQPVVSLGEQRATGVEALLRWQHPELGEVPPAEFVPIAERAGVIGELQRWALETAATAALTLPHTGEPLRLGVNISASHVAARTLVRDVAAVLQSTGLPPERLILEITEATLMSEGEHVAVDVEALRLMGVHVALDDFGTGRSSLAHLTRLPIDVLKLDHAFVLRVDRDPKARALCESVVAIAAALGLDVVAEGVETPAQLGALRAAGCGFAQGFLLARPMRPADLAGVLDDGAGLLWPGLVGFR
ncbi:bifunctional diguanylate cyclase/phosphodiesterase [Geodermatophilus sp. DSM 45219]|uniref:putative bifunctional diguanylate cyclase/phosphodiesterase n=1 Tax=Geodermatophilus sp. DSM 45219 TaxID=1881103 RepID=UPI0008922C24|nr:GGDEF domain-containing phosphodiesterase [Geodermatophilus sp. DSM 45219]SDO61592.1 PAS domain S-box-containing protein/diguanylate cyclase (GGDEF) domain-containing protein [Geodermatophilus sp. DSM 45219]